MRKGLLLVAILLAATACSKHDAEKIAATPNALTTTQPEAVSTMAHPATSSTAPAPAY